MTPRHAELCANALYCSSLHASSHDAFVSHASVRFGNSVACPDTVMTLAKAYRLGTEPHTERPCGPLRRC